MEIWFDDKCVFDQVHVQESHIIRYEFNDNEGDHELKFVLKNKLSEALLIVFNIPVSLVPNV